MDVDYFALENMFEISYEPKLDEVVGLIHIGARYTSINVRIPAKLATDSEVKSATDSRACRPGVEATRRDAGTAHISLQP